jgi:hypothetical protein
MDDILVFSKTLEEHKKHLQEVFDILPANSLYLKKSKCSFAQTKSEYLGHVISSTGVATAPNKIQAVKEWETPENAKQLRSFLGLAGYYRKFIQHYGLISKPLTDLLKKHSQFIWTPQHQHCFDTLKHALITSPVLSLPDFSKPFIIETDASDKGIGAVLMQQGHPVAYLSKALSNRSQALSTYEKECWLWTGGNLICNICPSPLPQTKEALYIWVNKPWLMESSTRPLSNCWVFSIKSCTRRGWTIKGQTHCQEKLFTLKYVQYHHPSPGGWIL